MPSELAMKAAEEIARDEGWLPTDDPTSLAEIIDSHGVLVSHEDAALLRQVKRLERAITQSNQRCSFIDYIGYAMDETQWKVAYDRGVNLVSCMADTLTEALKATLDKAEAQP